MRLESMDPGPTGWVYLVTLSRPFSVQLLPWEWITGIRSSISGRASTSIPSVRGVLRLVSQNGLARLDPDTAMLLHDAAEAINPDTADILHLAARSLSGTIDPDTVEELWLAARSLSTTVSSGNVEMLHDAADTLYRMSLPDIIEQLSVLIPALDRSVASLRAAQEEMY